MKILKSGTLTAFAALTMTASHGVHAMPKGRSLSPTRKAFAHKTLDFIKTQRKKSLFELDGHSLTAVALAHEAQALSEEEKSMEVDEFSDSNTSQEDFDHTSVDAEEHEVRLEEREAMLEESEMINKRYSMIKRIDELLNNRNFQDDFDCLLNPIKDLKAAVEKAPLDWLTLERLNFAMLALRELEDFDCEVDISRASRLINIIAKVRAVPKKQALKNELMSLTTVLTGLMKEKFSEEAQWVRKNLRKKNRLADLVGAFRAFERSVNSIEDLDLVDAHNFVYAMRDLSSAPKKVHLVGVIRKLMEAVLRLKSMKSEALEEKVRIFMRAITDLMKEKLSEEMQEIGVDLGKNKHLEGLESALFNFEYSIISIEDLDLVDARSLARAMFNLSRAAKDLCLYNLYILHDITVELKKTISHLKSIKSKDLGKEAHIFMRAITGLMKEKFSEEVQGAVNALRKNNRLAGLEKALLIFEDSVNSVEDLDLVDAGNLACAMRDLSRAAKEDTLGDIVWELISAISHLRPIKRRTLSENARIFITALTDLMKEKLSEEMQEIRAALRENNHMAGLEKALLIFEDSVNSVEGLDLADAGNLARAMSNLSWVAKKDTLYLNDDKLVGAISRLGSVKSEALREDARILTTTLTGLMKEKLSKEMQEARVDLGKNNRLAGLEKALLIFEDSVNSVEDLDLADAGNLARAMSNLSCAAKRNTLDGIVRELVGAISRLESMKSEALEEKARIFATALTGLIKEKLSEEMQEIRAALGKNNHLAGLVGAFESFEGSVSSIENLDLADADNLTYAMFSLSRAAKEDDLGDIIEGLVRAISPLKSVKSGALSEKVRIFITALTCLLREKLSEKMQEVRADLGKNNYLAGLVGAFESFEGSVNSIEDLGRRKVLELFRIVCILSRATKEGDLDDIIDGLMSVISRLRSIEGEALSEKARIFTTAIAGLIREKFSEEMQEVRVALGKNNYLAGLVGAFESFEGSVNSIEDLGKRNASELFRIACILSCAAKKDALGDTVPELMNAISRLKHVRSGELKESKTAFSEAIARVIDQVKGVGDAEVKEKAKEEVKEEPGE